MHWRRTLEVMGITVGFCRGSRLPSTCARGVDRVWCSLHWLAAPGSHLTCDTVRCVDAQTRRAAELHKRRVQHDCLSRGLSLVWPEPLGSHGTDEQLCSVVSRKAHGWPGDSGEGMGSGCGITLCTHEVSPHEFSGPCGVRRLRQEHRGPSSLPRGIPRNDRECTCFAAGLLWWEWKCNACACARPCDVCAGAPEGKGCVSAACGRRWLVCRVLDSAWWLGKRGCGTGRRVCCVCGVGARGRGRDRGSGAAAHDEVLRGGGWPGAAASWSL